jgi:hypothetical protein
VAEARVAIEARAAREARGKQQGRQHSSKAGSKADKVQRVAPRGLTKGPRENEVYM